MSNTSKYQKHTNQDDRIGIEKELKALIDDTGIFENRTYKDSLTYLQEYPDTSIIEMDTVIGCSKVIKSF